MDYNSLGRSGMKISGLGLGSSQYSFFCQKDNLHSIEKCLHTALDAGINYIDTSEQYGMGKSELILGDMLRSIPRDQIIIGTKVNFGGVHFTQKGLSFKHIYDGLHNSLRRLQTDYVDILFCHGQDNETPVSETVRAMDLLIRQGKIRYWGTSEWSKSQIEKAHAAARDLNAIPPLVEQTKYNLFDRKRVEEEYAPLYPKLKMGLTTYFALYGGLLTGKYQKGIPKGSRLGKFQRSTQEGYLNEEKLQLINELEDIASDLDCTLSQLALAWCTKNPWVISVVMGITSPEQIQDNIKAIPLREKLTQDVLKKIDRIAKKFS